ncbi:MAG TPA: protein kinase [Aggregatilineales bacterium]|nr:protein kinase [Aggregatilineales bacterium]
MNNLIGLRLGQYEIVARIGKGGMASVYRARQLSMGRDVALKVISPDVEDTRDFAARFEREARTVATLSHPYILKVFDYGQQDDLLFLAMELLKGGSLADLLRNGALSPQRVLQILDQISSALDYAHQQGIIHRDLKPQNVLLDGQGNAFLTDFGIAKILSETSALTRTGAAMGTPAYMSPEQWQGATLDARTDIYALGVMLFEMLTGQLPFTADTPYSLMHKHIFDQPPLVRQIRHELPQSVENVISKALAKEPSQRHESAGALAQAYKAALGGISVAPPQVDQDAQAAATYLAIPGTKVPDSGIQDPSSVDAPTTKLPVQTRRPGLFTRRVFIGGLITVFVLVLLMIGGAALLILNNHNQGTAIASVNRTPGSSKQPSAAPLTQASTVAPSVNPTIAQGAQPTQPVIVAPPQTQPGVAAASLMPSSQPPTATLFVPPTLTAFVPPSQTPTLVPPPPAPASQGRIAFVSKPGANSQIVAINPDGSNRVNLSNNGYNDSDPAWSPDGKQIAFYSDRDGPQEIFVMNRDGSGQHALTGGPMDQYPAWSPDGSQIVFMSKRNGSWQLYVMSAADGSAQTMITTSGGAAPAWSPDGSLIAYHSISPTPSIFLINATGGNPRPLTFGTNDWYPQWSPDGSRIVFMSKRGVNFQVYVMNSDGTNPANVSKTGSSDGVAMWSPDGSQIIFQSNRSGNYEIYIMNADGSGQHSLTHDGVNDSSPAWGR